MSTRVYIDGTLAPPISPAFDASWEATGTPTRRALVLGRNPGGTATVNATAPEAVTTNPYDVAIVQAISPPLVGSGTISGAIKSILRAQESNSAADFRSQCCIRVLSGDGTVVRGTLIAHTTGALSAEWANASPTNRKFPHAWAGSGATPTSVAYSAGDRIVAEFGFRSHNAVATSYTGTIVLGDTPAQAEAAENETDTTGIGWLEFADNLVFAGDTVRATHVYEEVLSAPTAVEVRASQVYEEVLSSPTSPEVRASQVYVEVLTGVTTPGLPNNSARSSASISG